MGLVLTMAAPRLSAFLYTPEDRDFRGLEHFIERGARRAVREPLVPHNRPDARPLRIRITQPSTFTLLRADTSLARFDLSTFRIEGIEENGRPLSSMEPEFDFNELGTFPPFSIHLVAAQEDRRIWRIDRLGAIRVEREE